MIGYQIETAILVVVGILLGALISMFYWKGQVNKREAQITELETTVEEKDTALKEMRTRSQELINEKGQEIESLNTQLKDTKNTLKDREKEIAGLNTQVSQRDQNISELNLQIGLKNESIDSMKKDAAELEQMNRDTVSRAEDAEAWVEELEKSVEELKKSLEAKENEATSLKARMRFMQDDFSSIAGIGPKVSAVLRSTGINTFETRLSRHRQANPDPRSREPQTTPPNRPLNVARASKTCLRGRLGGTVSSTGEPQGKTTYPSNNTITCP